MPNTGTRASVRKARFEHVQVARDRSYAIIAATITEGPQSERGKTVHISVKPGNLQPLELLMQYLKDQAAETVAARNPDLERLEP